jgi:hypothetical protein
LYHLAAAVRELYPHVEDDYLFELEVSATFAMEYSFLVINIGAARRRDARSWSRRGRISQTDIHDLVDEHRVY